jgi:ribosome-associated translation inhibitor RaiA
MLDLPRCSDFFHPQSAKHQGAPMKITYSHVDPEFRAIIEHETERHAAKLNRILKRYSPDLVVLHGSLEKTPRKTEFNFSLNLNLPTGTLHSTGVGADALGSAKAAFAELEVQVTKHQAKLRKDYAWKRKRAIALPTPRQAPTSD